MSPCLNRFSVLALLCYSSLHVAIATAAATCYKVDGTPQPLFQPCNPEAKISACCNSIDFCMSNGLCLDAGSFNNLVSVQGCTDQSWGAPCFRPCTGPRDNMGIGIISMIACNGDNQYCCGTDASCCNASTPLLKVPVASDLYRPPPLSISLVSSTSSPTADTTANGSPTPAVSSTTESSAPPTGTIAIALGAGIPVALLFIAAITFCGWQLRRRAQAIESLQAPRGAGPGPTASMSEHPILRGGTWGSHNTTSPSQAGSGVAAYYPPGHGHSHSISRSISTSTLQGTPPAANPLSQSPPSGQILSRSLSNSLHSANSWSRLRTAEAPLPPLPPLMDDPLSELGAEAKPSELPADNKF